MRSALILPSLLVLFTKPSIQQAQIAPDVRVYKAVGAVTLHAYVFSPAPKPHGGRRAAIVLFHGGGWTSGSPDWVSWEAQHYASLGLVSISAEYRLADQKTTTPLEAVEDARDLIAWARKNARQLGVAPSKIAAYGVSAGGHIASSAAIFGRPNERPNALLLLSPALDVEEDKWFRRLLGSRTTEPEASPRRGLKAGFPPTIAFVGESDTETPLPGAIRFRDAVRSKGGQFELVTYKGVGHLLTSRLDPQAQEQGPFDPDPKDKADSQARMDGFLRRLGFVSEK